MRILSIIFCVLLLVGCSNTQKDYVALPESMKSHINSSEVVFLHTQDKLETEIDRSNLTSYTGGGLLFALVDCAIDGSRAEDAQQEVEKIHKVLEGVDMDLKVRNMIAPIFEETPWLQNCQMDYLKKDEKNKDNDDQEIYRQKVKTTDKDVVMFVKFKYHLNPQFDTLQGKISLEMFPSSKTLQSAIKSEKPEETPIYKTMIFASQRLPNANKERSLNAQRWADHEGFLIKTSLHKLLVDLSKQLKNAVTMPTIVSS